MGKISHISHGLGPAHTGHTSPGNIARDGGPKRVHAIEVHPGMTKQTKTGATALGGNHASAIDALSGATVVPGSIESQPGYGNAGVRSGHPFAKAIQGKNLKPVQPSFGMKSRSDRGEHSNDLGEAILRQAFSMSNADDRAAHNRNRDGSKC